MTFFVLALIALALVGAPIFAVLSGFAILGELTVVHNIPTDIYGHFADALAKVQGLVTGDAGATLATIPLFTFMGYILAESKTAERLVACADALVGWLPGGLAVVTVGICAIFTTFTGASGVTIVAVGGLLVPAMIRQGYKERFAVGLITGTGSIGLLFPPALPLIIYGIVYGLFAQSAVQSSGDTLTLVDFHLDRFLVAGIVPGLVLVGSVCLYCVYRAMKDGVTRTPFVAGNALRATATALPEILIAPLMVLLLVTGFQPSEAAALIALYVLIVEAVIYRDIGPRHVPRIVRESMKLTGAILIVVFAATALTDYFVNAHIPERLFSWIEQTIHERWAFLLALNLFLLVVGSVMDIFSALLVVVPLIAPAAQHYQIDPYHLGVIFLLNLEIGYVHPPMGLNLFIAAHRFRKPMTELYWAIVPFLVIMVISLLIVTYVPALTPVRAKSSEPEPPPASASVAGAAPSAPPLEIKFPDGKVMTRVDCDKIEDPIDKANCSTMFDDYVKCDPLTDALEKMECQQKAMGLSEEDAGAK